MVSQEARRWFPIANSKTMVSHLYSILKGWDLCYGEAASNYTLNHEPETLNWRMPASSSCLAVKSRDLISNCARVEVEGFGVWSLG